MRLHAFNMSEIAPALRSPFLLCLAGMTGGMWLDLHRNVALLASLCISARHGPIDVIALHVQLMPAMHVGIAAAAVLSLCLDGCVEWLPEIRPRALWRSALCSGAMFAGMAAGTLAAAALAGRIAAPAHVAAEWLLMTAGMAAGMAVAHRAFDLARRLL